MIEADSTSTLLFKTYLTTGLILFQGNDFQLWGTHEFPQLIALVDQIRSSNERPATPIPVSEISTILSSPGSATLNSSLFEEPSSQLEETFISKPIYSPDVTQSELEYTVISQPTKEPHLSTPAQKKASPNKSSTPSPAHFLHKAS
jgi:hypothetical protein